MVRDRYLCFFVSFKSNDITTTILVAGTDDIGKFIICPKSFGILKYDFKYLWVFLLTLNLSYL